ncbi:hypothetical protein P7K49_016037 [Saguinus oedipus]|uniref:TGF-beta propeptide domain-containing protein n=1 Tax=Saguinus oedipus TaxID=9490 RepID=A0ABQ9VCY3_SAGOE|nr:hypothetical protein P7K49_016037 [Saguinus oedipus]
MKSGADPGSREAAGGARGRGRGRESLSPPSRRCRRALAPPPRPHWSGPGGRAAPTAGRGQGLEGISPPGSLPALAHRSLRCTDHGHSQTGGHDCDRRIDGQPRCAGPGQVPRGRRSGVSAEAADRRAQHPARRRPRSRCAPAEHPRPTLAVRPGPLWLLGLALCALGGGGPGPRAPPGCRQLRLGARELRDVQREILAVFGLPGRPRPRPRSPPAASRLPASAQLFMLDLYHAMASDDDEDGAPPERLLGHADLVMSFVNMGECGRPLSAGTLGVSWLQGRVCASAGGTGPWPNREPQAVDATLRGV